MLGYGLAGIVRKFVVWPAAMIWPGDLVCCALYRVFHNDAKDDKQNCEKNMATSDRRMSRFHFFLLIFFLQFLWYWIPGYICPILSVLSLFCLIDPTNIVLSQVTGVNGLGLGSLELDWNAWVAFLQSPIVIPFWAQLNIFIGFVILVWIITPTAYYNNLWNSKAMPIVSNRVFTVEGYYYNVNAVLDSRLHLNETAYNLYGSNFFSCSTIFDNLFISGPLRITALFAFKYGIQFAAVTCTLVYTFLNDGN
ncbi:unnamed protein product [Rotaria sp. Silwood1]|nr:unnamed protein product [Rotaria sp. Silwood1]